MDALYLVPMETIGNGRGPKYFSWRANPNGIVCQWSLMDYGFLPYALLFARGIGDADAAALGQNADVYAFPGALDQPLSGNDPIKTFLEGINIPTDWTTAATTYRQLLRSLAAMFQLAQRYGGISGGQVLFGAGVTLDTRYRNMTTQQKDWFMQTLTSFGYPTTFNQNSTLRQLLKQVGDLRGTQPFYLGGVGDLWGTQPFYLGGMEF